MEKLIYICTPNLFSMLFTSMSMVIFLLFIGFLVYKLQDKLNKSIDKGHFFIWIGIIFLFTISEFFSQYNIYQKVKNSMNDENAWIYTVGKIKKYHHIGFNKGNFILNHKSFDIGFIDGFNPEKNKNFKSLGEEIDFNSTIKIAYIDKQNPIIIKIWVLPNQ